MPTISNNDIAEAIYLSSHGKTGSHLSENLLNVTKFLSRRRLISKSGDILSRLNKIINDNRKNAKNKFIVVNIKLLLINPTS